jgi:hypothetical protein
VPCHCSLRLAVYTGKPPLSLNPLPLPSFSGLSLLHPSHSAHFITTHPLNDHTMAFVKSGQITWGHTKEQK